MHLNVREKMKKYREKHYITLQKMSRKTNVTVSILRIVEEGGVTHPNFVARIKAGYKLTELEAEQLLPECRRPHSPNYDPDRYVYKPDITAENPILPPRSIINDYFSDNYSKQYVKWY